MAREGQIKVQSEKIFPIIKKWLYSDKDIFLRELVSNASDAIKKLERLNAIGEADTGEEKGRIEIQIDPEAKTLSVSDNGIGMTEDEVEKYITQIAFPARRISSKNTRTKPMRRPASSAISA